jgi:hypothetical protein
MPINHPDVADLDDGATRVDGPRVLAAINDAFGRDPSIVRAPPPCPAAVRWRVRARAQPKRAPGVTWRGRACRLFGARMSLGCSWPTGLCRSRMRGSPRGKATQTTSGSMCSVLTLQGWGCLRCASLSLSDLAAAAPADSVGAGCVLLMQHKIAVAYWCLPGKHWQPCAKSYNPLLLRKKWVRMT